MAIVLALLVVASGCAERSTAERAPAARGEVAKPGTALAYAHSVRISLESGLIAERIEAARMACASDEFGVCSMLEFEQAADDYLSSRLVVRIVPAGVEPLIALAGAGGEIESNATSAEDLAEEVADTSRQKDRLELQMARLLEFQGRKDLTVSDMLTIARELAMVETQLADLVRTDAHQQRRIETNLLTIRFSSNTSESSWSQVPEVLSEMSDSLAEGTADAIETVVYALPFLVIWFPLLLILRLIWRWAIRAPEKRQAP